MQCRILALLAITLLVSINDNFANLSRIIGQQQQTSILGKNLLGSKHCVANPANQSSPVLRIIKNDGEMADLFCLNQQECLKEFIHCAETSWKDYKGLGVFDEHRFAHEKVAEVKRDVEVWIWALLKGKFNIAADRNISTFLRATVACFHNARTTAGYDRKASLCQQACCLYRGYIGWILGFCTCRAKDRDSRRYVCERVKAFYKFTHDTEYAPRVGEREIEMHRTLESMFFLPHLFLRHGRCWADQRLCRTV